MEIEEIQAQYVVENDGKTHMIPSGSGDYLQITPLGAGNEVGRSCIYLECKNRKILLDSGLHPGKEGIQSLPYFDIIEP